MKDDERYKLLCGDNSSSDSLSRLCASYYSLLHSRPSTHTQIRTPERILDAPNLVDDFYVNPVDWGNRGWLGIGLGEEVYLWREGEVVVELAGGSGGGGLVASVSFIHDGSVIAVGRQQGQLSLYNVETQSLIRTIFNPTLSRLNALSWNKHIITTGSKNGHVVSCDVRLPLPQCTMWRHSIGEEVCGLRWSWEGDRLAVGSNDNVVTLVDITGHVQDRLQHHRAAVKAISWCPYQSGLLATGGGTACQQLALWCTRSGRLLSSTNLGSQITNVLWDRGGTRHLAATLGFPQNTISILKHHGQQLEPVYSVEKAHEQRILHAAMGPTGLLCTAGADECIKMWRVFEHGLGGESEGKIMLPKLLPSFAKNKSSSATNSGNGMKKKKQQ